MTDPCPVPHCDRPCSIGKEMCLVCWRRVPMDLQRKLYVINQQMRFEPKNVSHQHAYLVALDRAIKSVPT